MVVRACLNFLATPGILSLPVALFRDRGANSIYSPSRRDGLPVNVIRFRRCMMFHLHYWGGSTCRDSFIRAAKINPYKGSLRYGRGVPCT